MKIQRIVSSLLNSNMYVVSEQGHAVLIDPCITDEVPENLHVDMILVTHEHYDHISGVNFWRDKTGAKFLNSSECDSGCINPSRNFSHYFNEFCALITWSDASNVGDVADYSCPADEIYTLPANMDWLGHNISVVWCPGHSSGGQCIVLDGEYLFSGDALINGYSVSCKAPGGSRKQWQTYSLPMLRAFDGSMKVFPGHFDSFTLSDYRDDKGGIL